MASWPLRTALGVKLSLAPLRMPLSARLPRTWLLVGLASASLVRLLADYDPEKVRMWLRWHLLMPALTALLGYFPARRLDWHEDLPAGAAYEWAFRPATLEAAYRHLRRHGDDPLAHFAAMRGDLLAVSLSDDPFGTPAAIERLLGYYLNSRRHHLHLNPADVGVPGIGHFAWFHERFRESLWPLSLNWLVHSKSQQHPLINRHKKYEPGSWPGRLSAVA